MVLNESFREYAADLLSRCFYRKDLVRLLAPETCFTPCWNAQDVRLENYYLSQAENAQWVGVCYELTYHAGLALQQQWGSQFVFMAADGNCPQFYFAERTNHTFILAFPRAQFARLAALLKPGQEPPAGVYILDPSLGNYGESQVDAAVRGYTIKYCYALDELEPARDRCEVLPFYWAENGYGQTHTLPLGLSRHLAPEVNLLDGDELLVIGFQIKSDEAPWPDVVLGSKKPQDDYPAIRRDVMVALPENNALRQVINFLKQRLSVPAV